MWQRYLICRDWSVRAAPDAIGFKARGCKPAAARGDVSKIFALTDENVDGE